MTQNGIKTESSRSIGSEVLGGLLVLFWAISFYFFNFDGNWYDVLPFARAYVDPGWIPADWYLSRDISYRNFFNIIAGHLYEILGIWPTYGLGKIFVYSYFAYIIIQLFKFFEIRLLAIAVFMPIFCLNHSLAADEWMINEFDTKTFSYLLAFHSLLLFSRTKQIAAAFLCGLSCSFHPLVGAYFFVSVTLPFLCWQRGRGEIQINLKEALIGFFLSILGASNAIVFAFSWLKGRGNPVAASLATEISIWIRLSNHLLPNSWNIPALTIGTLVLLALYYSVKRLNEKFAGLFSLWIVGAFSLFGIGIFAWRLEFWSILGLYTFRVPDVVIPFLIALLSSQIFSQCMSSITRPSLRKKVSACVITISILLGSWQFVVSWERFQKRRSEISFETFQWIKENTPKNAVFLTNPEEKYFYVFAERSSYVTFKHFPQLANDIVSWRDRMDILGCDLKLDGPIKNRKRLDACYKKKSLEELRQIAKRVGASYFLANQHESGYAPLYSGKGSLKVYSVEN